MLCGDTGRLHESESNSVEATGPAEGRRGRNGLVKLYHYTPLLAMRDRVVEEVRKVKAGKKSTNRSAGWGHATVDHNGHLISNWWFETPRGKREVYFDTGTLINTPGEVARQESARARYMGRMAPTLKVQ